VATSCSGLCQLKWHMTEETKYFVVKWKQSALVAYKIVPKSRGFTNCRWIQPNTAQCTQLYAPRFLVAHWKRFDNDSLGYLQNLATGWTVRGSNPGGSEISPTCPEWLCTMGTGSFPVVKGGRVVTLTPHPLLVPWSRKSRAIPLLPLWTVWPVQSLSACTRVHFTCRMRSYKCICLIQ